MDKYEDYTIEDFLSDEPFMTWVLTPDPAQEKFWNNWLTEHPEKQALASRAKNILLSLHPLPAATPLSADELAVIVHNIRQNIIPAKQKPLIISLISSTWFRVAAVLLIVLSFTFIIFKNKNTQSLLPAAVQYTSAVVNYVNRDQQAKFIKLSDGSLVILKPNSSLSYPQRFTGARREVKLVGEAFFEVHKNPQQPFLVYTHNMITRVLGTSFTVRAFPGEAKFKVIVNTGRVEVYERNKQDLTVSSVVLIPNQQATFTRKQSHLFKDTVTVPLMLSQKIATRVFSFNNAPLADIIGKLEEAYHVHINYDQAKFSGATVTASLSRLPLDEKIKMICKAIGAQCDFDNGTITIK
ncbi:FecR family protein [Mucilaginibacter sabulilitoris]|uniref:FecR family protein n=1 Tax=Mucilaginibacter sabulilitoris TaxID=1173583 RepID=A0ABZ0TJ15_9SPHI|nr:FecR family protein [Mucilaginibacter sabulilitoris]WPU92784.1 FecR family protein [Mucilaginibacter sabulilitoris]